MARLRRSRAALLVLCLAIAAACSQRTHRPTVNVVRATALEGDPYSIGLQHGSQLSGEINQFYTEFLRNSIFPFLNRERQSLVEVLTFYTTSPLYERPNFSRQILMEGAKSILDGIPRARREDFLAELRGIADGSRLPLDDVYILNTFLDSVTSILNVNAILDALDNPRVQRIEFAASLASDGLDNDGDGAADEPDENVYPVQRRSSPFALAKGVPTDAPVQVLLADSQLTCNRTVDPDPTCRACDEGEDPEDPDTGERVCFRADLIFGEGVDFNNPRVPDDPNLPGILRVNGEFAARCASDAPECLGAPAACPDDDAGDGCAGYKDNGTGEFPEIETTPKTQATFTIFPPPGGWLTDEPNVIEFRALDLARTIVPPPLHANDMRKERISFLAAATPGSDPRDLQRFPNFLPPGSRLDAEMYSLGVTGSLTSDGRLRVLRHFQLLDIDVAHKYARVFTYRPTGKTPYMTLAWSGFAAGITGMSQKGIVAAANWAETQDDSTAGAAVPALGILSPAIGALLIGKIDVDPQGGAPNAVRDAKTGTDYLCHRPGLSPNEAVTNPAALADDDRCCEARLLGDEVGEFDAVRDLCRVRSCFLGPAGPGGRRTCTFGVKKCETAQGEETCQVVGGVLQPKGTPIGFRLRQILEEADDLDEAIGFFRSENGSSAAGWNVLLADGGASPEDPDPFDSAPTENAKCRDVPGSEDAALALVEIDAGAPLSFDPAALGFKPGRDVACGRIGDAALRRAGASVSEERSDLRSCSHYQIDVPDSGALGPISVQSVWSPRYPTSTDTCGLLAEAVRERAGTLDDETLEEVFRDPRVVSKRGSMHGAIFDPAARSARVLLGQVPVTEGPFNDFSCEALGFTNCGEAIP